MKRSNRWLLVFLLCLPWSLSAQESEEKSPAIAAGLAVGGTALSYALWIGGDSLPYRRDKKPRKIHTVMRGLGIAGAIVAPSLGHFYAGLETRPVLTSGLRGGFVLLMYAGSQPEMETVYDEDGNAHEQEVELTGMGLQGLGAIVVGGISLMGLTLWDLVDAPFAANRAPDEFILQPRGLTFSGAF
jgi:hypothetical protein